MKSIWDEAAHEWHTFLVAIERRIRSVNEGDGTCWFRGQTSDFDLLPSLNRPLSAHVPDKKLREARQKLLNRLKLVREQMKLIAAPLPKTARQAHAQLQSLRIEARQINSDLATNKQTQEQRRISSTKPRIVAGNLETRAFHGYIKFHASPERSSWVTLAEMRHCGIKTRLLDWTENLSVACYFAVSGYRDLIRSLRRNCPKLDLELAEASNRNDLRRILKLKRIRTRPTVYVLNADLLAQKVSGVRRVRVISLEEELDYYARFSLRNDWPYRSPLPVTIPWSSPRQFAQFGHYAVFSNDPIAMQQDALLDGVINSERIPWLAAVYAAKLFEMFQRMDNFTVMQDIDSFGWRINDEFGL